MAQENVRVFKVPLLPMEWYGFIRQLSQDYGMSPRQVILAALRALKNAGPEAGVPLLEWAKETYPDNWDPKGWNAWRPKGGQGGGATVCR